MKKKNFLFSVIVPIYNVENYLEETIKSVINQSIGFENIELILVNDGSPDNSEEICLKYKEMYPDNVIYIYQENAGVSAARNNGLAHATGKYLNFLDSDDKWEKDAFKKALDKFNKYKDIDSVIFKLKFFEAMNKEHPINKIYGNKTKINILKDFECIKLSSVSLFFKTEEVKKYKFISNLKYMEDGRLVTEYMLDHPNSYIIPNSYYLYRMRASSNSAIQSSTKHKTWYFDTPRDGHKYLIDLSKKKYGKVIEYVQYIIVYDLYWRMNSIIDDSLTDLEKGEYKKSLRTLLKEVDDNIIINFALMKKREMLYMLSYKYNSKNKFTIKDNDLMVEKKNLGSYINLVDASLDNFYINNDKIDIYGYLAKVPNIINNLYIKLDNEYKEVEYYDLDNSKKEITEVDENFVFDKIGIHVVIDCTKVKKFNFAIKYKNKFYDIGVYFSFPCLLGNEFDGLYYRNKKTYFKYNLKNRIFTIYRRNIFNKVRFELSCSMRILKDKKYSSFIYRWGSIFYGLFHHKKIWLISDRIQLGGDNGETFFEYLVNKKDFKDKVYFVIKKDTECYNKLIKKYPKNVLAHNSLLHKLVFLNAKYIVSSHAENYIVNLFGHGKTYLADRYKFKYVFLQHGITKDDLSPWLNVNSKPMDMFVVATNYEYDSISNKYNYNYPKSIVKKTGFARFDKLKNTDLELNNTILLMPTWRKNLVTELDIKTGERVYDETFKECDYFKFYNGLINNKRLLEALKKYNFKIRFIPHINMIHQIDDFDKNECVEFVTDTINYTNEFIENKILITDFSSVYFDFAYLKKPVVYSQFDKETFWDNQIYNKSDFSYENDAFGPICTTIDGVVDEVIKLLDNDCKMDQKYIKRVDDTFIYKDQNNCERIYNEIKKL